MLPLPLEEWFPRACERHGVMSIPMDAAQAAASTFLPRIHADPADRIIIALAKSRRIPIVSPDRHFPEYPELQVIW